MIKKIMMLVFILGLIGGPVWAQDEAKPAAQKPIKTMIDYRDELGLSDEQVKEVAEALKTFQVTVKEKRTALNTQEKEFKELLKAKAPLPDIKSKLKEISETRFTLRYADVLTSRRVSDALAEEQMKKWREIQAKVRAAKAQK